MASGRGGAHLFAIFGIWIGLSIATSAWAVMPDRRHSSDIGRFGLNTPEPGWKGRGAPASKVTAAKAKALAAQGIRVRYHPQGRVSILSGRLTGPQAGTPEDIARKYLIQNRDILGVDPAALALYSSKQAGGVRHLLFGQTYNGLPVEFGRGKVHLSDRGEILGIDSGFIPGVNGSASPGISQAAAASAVGRDLGVPPPQGGTLVYLPVYRTGAVRLAWKFKVSGSGALWDYYIDAQTGEVLFRVNKLHYATSGVVTAQVYTIDPTSTPVLASVPLSNQNVYVYGNAVPVVTAGDGSYTSATNGKISAALQGPYLSVAHFNLTSAHYDNGAGVWFTAATLKASPNPYPSGVALPNSIVYVATITSPAPPAPYTGLNVVAAMPHFSLFQVGSISANSCANGNDWNILQDDQVREIGLNGAPAAYYIGNQTPFLGAPVQGLNPSIVLQLAAAPAGSGTNQGFVVDISSFLVLPNVPTSSGTGSSFQWTAAMTADAGRQPASDEINVFYHLNKMHDYFLADVDKSSAAYISNPTVAIVHAGPCLANAFYNPDFDNITFGDAFPFALDATVSHHEYTHFVINKIFPVINFGQAGAISEANADYFSASSLNDASIGGGIGAVSGDITLRNLDCKPPNASSCLIFNPTPTLPNTSSWSGEIHDDSRFLSQTLWEIRSAVGASCADELAFQTLFYFPDSFEAYLNGMLQVSAHSSTMAPLCGANGTATSAILARFAYHFPTLTNAGGDAYEPNDGPQTATNISTLPVIAATIYPAADEDYYAFGAGAGMIKAVLSLPAIPGVAGTYFAYGMVLLDRQLNILTEVFPAPNNPDAGGGCPNSTDSLNACRTVSPAVELDYNNPSASQFYLLVMGAPDDNGSNSAVNSQLPYYLNVSYPTGALGASIVIASFDNDVFHFSVNVSSYARIQNYAFDHAQLRDQSRNILVQTATNGAAPYMTMVSTSGSFGNISGTLKLMPGFASRYPAAGTVYLEIFGANTLQQANSTSPIAGYPASPQSLGLSNPINLTAGSAGLTAWNNIFNPLKGQKATFQYETTGSGRVQLRLYTMSGTLVQTLIDGDYSPGKGTVDWYGNNSSGQTVASGIYLLYLSAPGVNKTQKVVVVK